jgi:septal ring factor EnvC (AmiA/AmiB activator)
MAKWDLSKLPEGRKPLPDEWFRERAQMQERIAELEAENDKLKAMVADVINDTGDDPEIMAASRAEWAARALEAEAKLVEYKMIAGAIDKRWAESEDEVAELRAKLAWAEGELEEMLMIQNSEAAYGILRVYTKALVAELKGQSDD